MCNIKEYQDLSLIMARVDERVNIERTEIDGKQITIIHKGYGSRDLFQIENFVKDVVTKKRKLLDKLPPSHKAWEVCRQHIAHKYFRQANGWLERYSGIHRYSARVEAFYDCCLSMGLISNLWPSTICAGIPVGFIGKVFDINGLEELIEQVFAQCHTREFKERERLRLANAELNRRSVLKLEEDMFSTEGKSRWLILSLTLGYKPYERSRITPEIIQRHRCRFFAARRFNRLMSGIKNYVWTIEEGEDTGLHLHVILFYSAVSNHDEYLAQQIGEYWANIVTKGKGDYWNSNGAKLKKKYEKYGHGIGVGQINWSDSAKREALRINLEYLAKTEQYLMIKSTSGIHTFGMGQMPKKEKAGRPRAS